METTIKSNQKTGLIQTEKVNTAEKQNSDFWKRMESVRFAVIPMQLFILGCISGIAAAFGAHGQIIKLAMIAFPTIIALALTLAVSPMRTIIWASGIAVVLDLLVFFI